MTTLVKILFLLETSNAVHYGFTEKQIADCIGKTIEAEIALPYVKGSKQIIIGFLPTDESLRYGRKIVTMEVEVI